VSTRIGSASRIIERVLREPMESLRLVNVLCRFAEVARQQARVIGVSWRPLNRGGEMYARIATFESDPANVDDAISMVRAEVESGETPPGLEGAKMMMLVNRETGKGVGITLFESEEAMRRGDEALNAMNPGGTERRTSVEFYEVPVHTVS
jgi:hypothetical protein